MKTSLRWIVGLLGLSMLTASNGAPKAPKAPKAFPEYCKASEKVTQNLRKIKGLNLREGVNVVCSADHPDCCGNLVVTVTLTDLKDPLSCVATLNYGSLTIDLRNGYKPELFWSLDTSATTYDYVFDKTDGIQRLAIPGTAVSIVDPHGAKSWGTRFKWTDSGSMGAANHQPVVHPKSNPLFTCEPKDPGIVNEQ